MNEFLRHWKLATFAIGLSLLIIGAHVEKLPDWDVGVSVLMATLTYLTAPWSIRALITGRLDRWAFIGAFWCWLTVDGVYWAWNYQLPNILDFREANLPCSLALYFLCGIVWSWNGSIADLSAAVRALRKDPHQRPSTLL